MGNYWILKVRLKKTERLEVLFAQSLLAKQDYSSVEKFLADLEKEIVVEQEKLSQSVKIPANLPVVNAPPNVGYCRQKNGDRSG